MKKKNSVVHAQIPYELGERVKAYSEKTGITITAIVTQALTLYLQQQDFVADLMSKALTEPDYLAKLKSVVDSIDDTVSVTDESVE